VAVAEVTETEDAVIVLCGAALTPDPGGALWWAATGTLVVSDLHLEKGSAYAARGQALPPFDTRATLTRLKRLVAKYRPLRLIALGDSFHDKAADARMGAEDRLALASLVARVESWVWIAGNHDPAPPVRLGGVVAHELKLRGLTFRHEPTGGEGEIAGHLHPCAIVGGRGRALRRRCFASDGVRLVAPAFGAFAGGLNLRDAAFGPAFPDRPPTAHVLGRDRVWPVRPERLLAD
jgi:DNA ligase-associated metallophosphoesterase